MRNPKVGLFLLIMSARCYAVPPKGETIFSDSQRYHEHLDEAVKNLAQKSENELLAVLGSSEYIEREAASLILQQKIEYNFVAGLDKTLVNNLMEFAESTNDLEVSMRIARLSHFYVDKADWYTIVHSIFDTLAIDPHLQYLLSLAVTMDSVFSEPQPRGVFNSFVMLEKSIVRAGFKNIANLATILNQQKSIVKDIDVFLGDGPFENRPANISFSTIYNWSISFLGANSLSFTLDLERLFLTKAAAYIFAKYPNSKLNQPSKLEIAVHSVRKSNLPTDSEILHRAPPLNYSKRFQFKLAFRDKDEWVDFTIKNFSQWLMKNLKYKSEIEKLQNLFLYKKGVWQSGKCYDLDKKTRFVFCPSQIENSNRFSFFKK